MTNRELMSQEELRWHLCVTDTEISRQRRRNPDFPPAVKAGGEPKEVGSPVHYCRADCLAFIKKARKFDNFLAQRFIRGEFAPRQPLETL